MTKRLLSIFLMAAVAPLSAQENLFLEGRDLFYNNHFADAQAKLQLYRDAHPDDTLVALRLLYNRFFESDHGRDFSENGYQKFLGEISAAIQVYETKDCHAIDFALAGRGLDCGYIGAGLYSLRMALYAQDDSFFKAAADRKKFLVYVRNSKSPQTKFLLAMYEYEPSQWGWKKRVLANKLGHVPTDRDHAITIMLEALEGNHSPFVDDVWFAILKIERESDGKNPCDPNRRGDTPILRKLLREHPPRRVLGDLLSKYPDNAEVRTFARACGVSLK